MEELKEIINRRRYFVIYPESHGLQPVLKEDLETIYFLFYKRVIIEKSFSVSCFLYFNYNNEKIANSFLATFHNVFFVEDLDLFIIFDNFFEGIGYIKIFNSIEEKRKCIFLNEKEYPQWILNYKLSKI